MSRYTGPRLKVMRALGIQLPGLSSKSIEDRPYPPGQHGLKQKRKSDFGLKLMEKQKLRYNYGLNETQIRRLFVEARHAKMPTGDKLPELLERRLDNAVFRAGFAPPPSPHANWCGTSMCCSTAAGSTFRRSAYSPATASRCLAPPRKSPSSSKT